MDIIKVSSQLMWSNQQGYYCGWALFNWKPTKEGLDTPWVQRDSSCQFGGVAFWRSPVTRTWGQAFGPGGILWPIVSKKLGPQPYSPKEMNTAIHLNDLGSRFSLVWPPGETQLSQHLDCSLVRPWTEEPAKLCQDSRPKETGITNVCWVKSLHFW